MSTKTALEVAEELFASYCGPGSKAAQIGDAALRILLEGTTPDALRAAETHCLLRAYNWTGRNKDGFELAKRSVKRWGEEFLPDLNTAFHNAYYWPKWAYVAIADELIREGIGPAFHWYLRKADWWVREATGEHDSEYEWFPGHDIANQSALDQAAIELDFAIEHLTLDPKLSSIGWKERYAPILEQPRFARLHLSLMSFAE